jgi:hypothetical protein
MQTLRTANRGLIFALMLAAVAAALMMAFAAYSAGARQAAHGTGSVSIPRIDTAAAQQADEGAAAQERAAGRRQLGDKP